MPNTNTHTFSVKCLWTLLPIQARFILETSSPVLTKSITITALPRFISLCHQLPPKETIEHLCVIKVAQTWVGFPNTSEHKEKKRKLFNAKKVNENIKLVHYVHKSGTWGTLPPRVLSLKWVTIHYYTRQNKRNQYSIITTERLLL